MITPSHILINAAIAQKNKERLGGSKYVWAAAIGGVLPDIPIYIFSVIVIILRLDMRYVWDELYFTEPLQILFNSSHSFILFSAIILLAFLLKNKWGIVAGASAFFHTVTDFLLHATDAYAHFFPLSNWRFQSPISYYETDFFGREFAVFEAFLGLTAAYYMITVVTKKWHKIGFWAYFGFYILYLGIAITSFFLW